MGTAVPQRLRLLQHCIQFTEWVQNHARTLNSDEKDYPIPLWLHFQRPRMGGGTPLKPQRKTSAQLDRSAQGTPSRIQQPCIPLTGFITVQRS